MTDNQSPSLDDLLKAAWNKPSASSTWTDEEMLARTGMTRADHELFNRTGQTRATATTKIRDMVTQRKGAPAEAMVTDILDAWIDDSAQFVGYRDGLGPFVRCWLAARYETWTA